ncbi:MAG: bifunctional riboflavin kinase/FAD synthetase, partial [bacterium]
PTAHPMDIIHFTNHEGHSGPHPAVVTIGNFDGVHLGHQALIGRVVAEAGQMGVASALLTFHPHPQTIIRGEAPPMITPSTMRLRLFEQSGLDAAYFIPFTREFSKITPKEFVNSYLSTHFQIRKLMIGYDFHFGKGRSGSAEVLKRLSKDHGFDFEAFPEVSLDGRKVSSSAIRAALGALDFETARAFLGRPFSILEKVIQGERRGRALGFPTLNQKVEDPLPIPFGVYASRAIVRDNTVGVNAVGERTLQGISNYGIRPTVGGTSPVLETHLFDFEQDLYGELVEVIPLHRLREERKFASLEDLTRQIGLDCDQARAFQGETS